RIVSSVTTGEVRHEVAGALVDEVEGEALTGGEADVRNRDRVGAVFVDHRAIVAGERREDRVDGIAEPLITGRGVVAVAVTVVLRIWREGRERIVEITVAVRVEPDVQREGVDALRELDGALLTRVDAAHDLAAVGVDAQDVEVLAGLTRCLAHR